MAVEKIGLNLSKLGEVSPPNITFPSTGKEILQKIPETANTLTLGYFGHIVLGGFSILMYLILSDKSPFGEFKYSDLRALTLASGITSLFALTMLELGFISNFYILGLMVTIFIIGNILLIRPNTGQ